MQYISSFLKRPIKLVTKLKQIKTNDYLKKGTVSKNIELFLPVS